MVVMTFTIMGLACGSVGVGINTLSDQPWWVSLLIAVIPTLVGVMWDIFRNIAVKKGWLSNKTASKIDEIVEETIEDIKDDGKINKSNKD